VTVTTHGSKLASTQVRLELEIEIVVLFVRDRLASAGS